MVAVDFSPDFARGVVNVRLEECGKRLRFIGGGDSDLVVPLFLLTRLFFGCDLPFVFEITLPSWSISAPFVFEISSPS